MTLLQIIVSDLSQAFSHPFEDDGNGNATRGIVVVITLSSSMLLCFIFHERKDVTQRKCGEQLKQHFAPLHSIQRQHSPPTE